MANDDQHFLNVIAEYSKDVRSFTGSILDASDRHFAHIASYFKKHVPEGWIPEHVRTRTPLPPPHALTRTHIHGVQHWTSRNRAWTAAIVAFCATTGLLLWRESNWYKRKRRANRASNGARLEVVVIAGPPNSPITRSIALDLEKRGYVVYIVCSTMDEEQQVLSEARADIRPLHLDVVDVMGTQEKMARFHRTLTKQHFAFAGASPHRLSLGGILLVPDLIYPAGPIETIPAELWSDAFNAKVLNTVAVTQALLPTISEFKSRVILLTPSIMASLRPPFHSVETTIVCALEGFLASLRAELGTLGIDVIQFHLGTFDLSNVGPKHQLQAKSAGSANLSVWPTTTRALYASNFVTQTRVAQERGLVNQGGSSLRCLHYAVVDALTQRRPRRVWRVGRGSVMYDAVGTWLPNGLVGWMMGLRRVSADAISTRLEDSVQSWEKIDAIA